MALDTDDLERALPGLMRYALMLTHSREAAEDLVQDVVVKALQRAESFRGEGSAAGWLHRIMHSTFIDGVRRRREEPTDPDLLAAAIEKDWRADDFTTARPSCWPTFRGAPAPRSRRCTASACPPPSNASDAAGSCWSAHWPAARPGARR
jgi:DNA-directed RNA polymerase specialized sigma24 family protein